MCNCFANRIWYCLLLSRSMSRSEWFPYTKKLRIIMKLVNLWFFSFVVVLQTTIICMIELWNSEKYTLLPNDYVPYHLLRGQTHLWKHPVCRISFGLRTIVHNLSFTCTNWLHSKKNYSYVTAWKLSNKLLHCYMRQTPQTIRSIFSCKYTKKNDDHIFSLKNITQQNNTDLVILFVLLMLLFSYANFMYIIKKP